MKLKEFADIINQAVERAGETEPDIEVYDEKERRFNIMRVGQFHLIPDVVITMREVAGQYREPEESKEALLARFLTWLKAGGSGVCDGESKAGKKKVEGFLKGRHAAHC